MSESTNKSIAAQIAEAVAHYRTDNLRGFVSREDLQSDAWILLADGTAATVADAVRIAFNNNREERVNDRQVRFAYLSTIVEDSDGETTTLAEKLGDTVAALPEGEGRGGDYTRADLVAAVAATRHAKTERAHGWANAARGAVNGARGVANDATILAAVEAGGGRFYGYAAKVAAALTAEGWSTNANAVRVAVHRAMRRTEGGDHSANGI